MLLKMREVSSKQQMLEIINRRLSKSHAKYDYFQEMLRRTKAGYAGEKRVDQEWKEIYLQQVYYLLHDVEFTGRVDFMAENHQFIRVTSDGRVDGFRNPLDQVKRHARFMSKNASHERASYTDSVFVISANPNMIMSPRFATQPILHVSGLAERVEPLNRKHRQVCISEADLTELSEHLLQMHKPTDGFQIFS